MSYRKETFDSFRLRFSNFISAVNEDSVSYRKRAFRQRGEHISSHFLFELFYPTPPSLLLQVSSCKSIHSSLTTCPCVSPCDRITSGDVWTSSFGPNVCAVLAWRPLTVKTVTTLTVQGPPASLATR